MSGAAAPSPAIDHEVRGLVYRGCLLLDQGDFKAWLDLCAPDFRYTISTWSPEIRREQVWLDHDLDGMRNLVQLLPRHNSDQTPLTRHATVYTVEPDGVGTEARAVTSVAIFSTALDGGETALYCLARYHDVIDLGAAGARLKRRVVRLETRSLGIGKHWPL
jgi:methanesulfonate monooxygenase subunit beta